MIVDPVANLNTEVTHLESIVKTEFAGYMWLTRSACMPWCILVDIEVACAACAAREPSLRTSVYQRDVSVTPLPFRPDRGFLSGARKIVSELEKALQYTCSAANINMDMNTCLLRFGRLELGTKNNEATTRLMNLRLGGRNWLD